MDAYYREFGARVRSARGGRSQAELAAATGMTRAAIANIELGRHRVTLDVLDRIARALRVDPASLLPTVAAGSEPLQGERLSRADRRALDLVLARAGMTARESDGQG